MSSMGNFFHWWATTVISYVINYVVDHLCHQWATSFIWWATTVISYVINYVVDHLCHQWATSFIGGPLLSLVMSLLGLSLSSMWATTVISYVINYVGHYCH